MGLFVCSIAVVLAAMAGLLYGICTGDAIAMLGGVLIFVGGGVALVSIARRCGERI
jgi:hypothetical protein